MATNILDAFLITFGLDASGYKKGEREVRDSNKRTREDSKNTFDDIEKRAKKGAESVRSLVNNVASLVLVFAGAKSVGDFASDLLHGEAAAGRLSQTLGLTTSRLVAWQEAVRQMGGDPAEASSALQAMQTAIQSYKLTGTTGMDADLRGLGITNSDLLTKDPSELLMKLAAAGEKLSKPEFAARLQRIGIPQSVIYMLEQGNKKLRDQIDASEKLAHVTERDAEEAQKFEAQMARLQTLLKGEFRPILTEIVDDFFRLTKNVNDGKSSLNVAIKIWHDMADAIGGAVSKLQQWLGLSGPQADKDEDIVRRYLMAGQYHNVWLYAMHRLRQRHGLPDPPNSMPPPPPGGWDPQQSKGGSGKGGTSDEEYLRQHGWRVEGGRPALTPQAAAAKAAIEAIGGHISSPGRTYAQQAKLYADYLAGRGPLAAPPGHSAHESGRALDISLGAGISLATIAAALLKAHVPFSDLRFEGNHYHVALGARARRGAHSVHIGTIHVHTRATDAHGIARGIGGALRQRGVVTQADGGVAP